nr:carbonic anhydrase-like [Onthophagus taurus]
MLYFLILFLTTCGVQLVLGSNWSYGDSDSWPGVCQTGSAQSPIDLIPSKTTDRVYSAFIFENYDKAYQGRVKNNGHSIAITLLNGTDGAPIITGGGLNDKYILDHIHFHWESEHTVNGESFPLEMHLVHYSIKYSSLTEAAESQGIAVLGVFFEISLDDDDDFIPLVEVMDRVEKNPSQEVALERMISPKSFLPRHTSDYFRYQGSLTTPGCNEGVTWTLFRKPLPISADQYTHFESIWSEEGPLTLNFRKVQPLNGRTVTLRQSPGRSYNGKGFVVQSNVVLTILTTLFAFKSFY